MNKQNDPGHETDAKPECCQQPLDSPEHQASKILGMCGKFQIVSLIMLCPAFMCLGMIIVSPVFTNNVPVYECRQPPISLMKNASSLMKYRNKPEQMLPDQCLQYNFSYLNSISGNEVLLTNASIAPVSTGQCRNGWNYDTTYGNSVVSEFDLICESGWKRPLIVAAFILGTLVGSPCGGHVSDRYGRKRTSLVTFVSIIFLQTALSFSPHYVFYVVFMFVSGIFLVVLYFNCFVWTQELVHGAQHRIFAVLFTNCVYSFGTMANSLVVFLVPGWRWMYRVMAIVCLFSFIIACFVSESPSWLLQKRKSKAVNKLIKRIASVNKIQTENKNKIFFISSFNENKSKNKTPKNKISPLLLWKNKVLRRRMFFVCYIWVNSYLGYFTMSWNTGNFGGNIYINNILGGAMDIGSNFLIIVMLKKMSRRTSLASIFALFACFCVLTPTVRQEHEVAGVAFALVGRFFATASMWLCILFSGEIFPTLLRSTSVGLAGIPARIGSIASPFLIFAGEELDLSIPFYIMSGISIFGCCVSLLLPETSSTLPESMEDALALKDGVCRISCTRNREDSLEKKNSNEV